MRELTLSTHRSRWPARLSWALLAALFLAPLTSGGVTPDRASAASKSLAPAPALSLSRTQGPPGAPLRVRGFHFTTTSPLTVTLNGVAITSTTTTAAGAFNVLIAIPQVAPGSYTLGADDVAGLSVGVTFVVTARPPAHISVHPHRAPPGAILTIFGSHFAAGEAVTVTLGGSSLGTMATATGTISLTMTVPVLAPGEYALTATGGTSGLVATTSVAVVAPAVPRIAVSPDSAPPGTTVNVRGRNFAAAEPVTLTLNTTVLTSTVADAHGAFTSTFTVPVLPTGAYSLTASGVPGAPSAARTFIVGALPAPQLTVSRLTAVPGRMIVVHGRNFGATQTVQIQLGGTTVATATTTARGSFTAQFVVPPLAPQTTTLAAIASLSGATLSVSFQVLAPPPPAFGLSARAAAPGALITAQGRHFGASETVNITFGSLGTVATVTTTAAGAFKITFIVPDVPLSQYVVTAIGLQSAISATFPLNVVAPPRPSLDLARHAGLVGAFVPARGYHFGRNEEVVLSIGSTQVATTTTTAHGTFYVAWSVPALGHGVYTVTATGAHSGIVATSFFVVNPAPFGTLNGTVTDAVSSAPLAGAVIQARQQGTGRYATTTTDNNGFYTLKLRTGEWRVDAIVRDGLHLRLAPVYIFVGAEAVTSQNFSIPRAPALIEGSIYGPASTTITVTAQSKTDASQVAVTTDTSGHATYTLGATIGLWHVSAVLPFDSRAGYDAPHSRAIPVTSVGTSASPVIYSSGTTLTFIAAPYTIVVTVKDSTGAPITSGVWVSAYSPDFPNGGIGVGTDQNASGVYTLHVAGATWRVNVTRHNAPSPVPQRLITNAANPSVALSFTLQAAPNTISGVIYNSDGLPIANAVIRARSSDDEIVSTRSSATGAYSMYVFPDTWTVLAFAPDLGLVGRADITVTAGVNVTQDFAAPLTYRVGGTVRVGGDPLAFASLHAYAVNARNSGQTDLHGTYSMLLPVGAYTLKGYAVQAGTLGDHFFTVSGPVGDEDVDLPAQGMVHITVQVGGVTINDPYGTAARVSAWDGYTGYWNVTSDNVGGVYNLPLLAGVYSVRVKIPGQGELEQRNVQVLPNGVINLTFNFAAFGGVQGTVSDTSGAPIFGAAVFAQHRGIDLRTITDSRGYYAIQVQPGATYTLKAQQPGYVLTATQKVSVTVPATQTVNLVMAPATSRVSGDALVARTNGAPAVFAWIWATNPQGGYAQARVDGFGNWSVRLTPGTWLIHARFDGYHLATPLSINVPSTGTVSGVHLLLTPVPAYQPPLPAAAAFSPDQGVTVGTPDNRFEVQVPANAAGTGSAAYSIAVQETTSVPDAPGGAPLGERGVEVSVDDASNNPLAALNSTATLNFTYDPTALPAGVSASALTVGYLDTTTGTWQPLPSIVDEASHTISVSSTQLGTFAILLPGA